MLELSRWAPKLRVVRFHTNDVDERRRLRQEVRSAWRTGCWNVSNVP